MKPLSRIGTNKTWALYLIFPALFSLLVTYGVLDGFSGISMALLAIWTIRLVCLRKREVFLTAILLGAAVGLRTAYVMKEAKTELDLFETEFQVEVYPETLKMDGDRLEFYGAAENSGSSSKVKEEIVVFYTFSSKEEKEKWKSEEAPEKVLVQGGLEAPDSQRNPHQFDYAAFLNHKQIYWVLEAEHLKKLPSEKTEEKSVFSVLFQPSKWRNKVLTNLENRLTGKSLDYIKMMLFADKRDFDQSVREDFQKIGIVHLLSISGLHIHFLIGGMEWILLRTGVSREKIPPLFVLLLPIYGTLAGWGTSVFRAVCMSWFVYVGRTFSLPMKGVEAWSLALLLACFLNPYAVYSAGFQLSYALSLTLLLIQSSKWYTSIPVLYSSLVTTMILSFVSIPILSYHFFEFPWFSLLSNSVFIPLFSWLILPLLVCLLFISLLLPGTGGLLRMNAWVDAVLLLMEKVVESISTLPYLTMVTGRLPWMGTLTVCLGLLFIFYSLERTRMQRKKWLICGFAFFTVGLFSQKYSPAGKVVMMDVGQGESILIKRPFGKMSVLIDTGGQHVVEKEEWQLREEPYSVAKKVVIPVLKSYGVDSLDQVILTHSDVDHTGSLLEISEEIAVKDLVLTRGTLKDAAILPAAAELTSHGTEIFLVEASLDKPVVLQSDLGVLWPFSGEIGGNDESIVLYGSIGGHRWLFTGDLEEAGESSLLKAYPGLQADILKAGHHGSRTSTNELFLKTVSPADVWISCGKNNWYGHPHEEVVERLHNNGADVWRTDHHGGLVFTFLPFHQKERNSPVKTDSSHVNDEAQIK